MGSLGIREVRRRCARWFASERTGANAKVNFQYSTQAGYACRLPIAHANSKRPGGLGAAAMLTVRRAETKFPLCFPNGLLNFHHHHVPIIHAALRGDGAPSKNPKNSFLLVDKGLRCPRNLWVSRYAVKCYGAYLHPVPLHNPKPTLLQLVQPPYVSMSDGVNPLSRVASRNCWFWRKSCVDRG